MFCMQLVHYLEDDMTPLADRFWTAACSKSGPFGYRRRDADAVLDALSSDARFKLCAHHDVIKELQATLPSDDSDGSLLAGAMQQGSLPAHVEVLLCRTLLQRTSEGMQLTVNMAVATHIERVTAVLPQLLNLRCLRLVLRPTLGASRCTCEQIEQQSDMSVLASLLELQAPMEQHTPAARIALAVQHVWDPARPIKPCKTTRPAALAAKAAAPLLRSLHWRFVDAGNLASHTLAGRVADKDAGELLFCLRSCKQLHALTLSNISGGLSILRVLRGLETALPEMPDLQALRVDFGPAGDTDEPLAALGVGVTGQAQLTSLALSGVRLATEYHNDISDALTSLTALQRLELHASQWRTSQLLAFPPLLRSLALTRCAGCNVWLPNLASIPIDNQLTELDLQKSVLQSAGAETLAGIIQSKLPALRTLNLSQCQIEGEGAVAIAAVLAARATSADRGAVVRLHAADDKAAAQRLAEQRVQVELQT